ncbi:MAG: hypothetical protein E5W82_10880 [Mesorhizobium sp.]|nr:MAG: hypothetical protein E5W82_10880 [Mesorhizobium sp.]
MPTLSLRLGLASIAIFGGFPSASNPPENTVVPAISGVPTVGLTLSCSTGIWTGTGPLSYAYQWKADGTNISGATASTFLLTSSEVGKAITCAVSATNAAGSGSATSAATSAVETLSYTSSGGSGNRSSLITITTDATMLGSGGIAVLIDGAQTDSAWFMNGQTGKYVKFDFGAGNYKIISELKWYQNNTFSQNIWVLDGSNDDVNWVPITDSFELGTSATTTIALSYNANKGYRYYRLLQVSGTTTSAPYLREIEFKIASAPQAVDDNSAIPSYLNPGATGDRTASITVTSSMSPTSGSLLSNFIDGAFGSTSTDSVELPAALSGQWITFDFGSGVSKIITGFVWWASTFIGQGDWKLQGSNDNSAWTDLSTSVPLGGAVRKVYHGAAANTTGYRYYRLLQTSGLTSGNPWNEEVQFEIAA